MIYIALYSFQLATMAYIKNIEKFRISLIELEQFLSNIYGFDMDQKHPRLMICEPSIIPGQFPHGFIMSDYMYWGRPEVQEELKKWLLDNFEDTHFQLRGMVISFREAKEAMWFRLRWDGIDN